MYNYHIPFSSLLVIIKAHVKIDLLSAWVPRWLQEAHHPLSPPAAQVTRANKSLCWVYALRVESCLLLQQNRDYPDGYSPKTAFNTTQMEGTLEMVKSEIRFQSILNWTSEDQRAPRTKEAISPHSSVRIHALTSRRAAWSFRLPEQPGENSPSSASPHIEGRF